MSRLHLLFASRRAIRFFMLMTLVTDSASFGTETKRWSGAILENTEEETRYFVQETGRPGPTVMISGGVHGDEPAGAAAANQVRHWPIVRGKIIVLPRANVLALDADSRLTPTGDESQRNLNRNFPRIDQEEPPRGKLAKAIWTLVQQHNPDWLLDLHEGFDFHQINPESVGSSVIAHTGEEDQQVVTLLLETINGTIADEKKHFVRLSDPVDGSLVRAAIEHLGAHAMILETTSKDQPLSFRARQHRILVHRCLEHLQMLADSVTPNVITDGTPSAGRLRVALYDRGGIFGKGMPKLLEILNQNGGHHSLSTVESRSADFDTEIPIDLAVELVGPPDVRAGVLKQFHVVIFSGGSGSAQARSLEEKGRREVKRFVESGAGFIVICGGAYLACDGFPRGLKVLDAKTVSPKFLRGNGTVEKELTDKGRDILCLQPGMIDIRYVNGPIMETSMSHQLPDYQPLAYFRSELAENGSPAGAMIDSPAIVAGRYGKGRVLCFSPHPELTKGLDGLVTCALAWVSQPTQPAIDADVLLRGGMLHLGDGSEARIGDVAIVGERIVAVGEFELGNIKRQIDCRDLIISPGFIDLHNHSDGPVLEKNTRAVVNFLTQGCTTVVTGNCGGGPVNASDYYSQIDQFGAGVNVAHLLPHGTLRQKVMGNERRKPSPDELAKMKRLTAQAMEDGVWGMSTGLIYAPGSYADTKELVELAKIVSQYDGIYASHIRNEETELLTAIEEAMEIGRIAKLPVQISHLKSIGKDAWGLVRVATKMIEDRRRAGQRVTADQYPYAASSTSLGATLIPTWAFEGGHEKLLARLDDPVQGPRVQAAISERLRKFDGGQRLQIASYAAQPDWAGQRLADIARDENMEPVELVLQITRNGGAMVVNHSMNEEDVRFVMAKSWVATASDGGAFLPGPTVPHPRNYGTFPRKIGYYAIHENVVPLEQAIRSSTGLPADILGLKDRGYLRPGYWADVIVFDPEKFRDAATFDDPHRYSQGLVHVFVNGQPALTNGVPTGALAGRALRKTELMNEQ